MGGKGGDSVSFGHYKFCQSGTVTIASAAYAMMHILFITGDMSWWAALLIGAVATFVWFLPILAFFYPVAFAVYLVIAVARSIPTMDIFFWIALAVLCLHVYRWVALFVFVRREPQLSLMYDEAIRYGVKP